MKHSILILFILVLFGEVKAQQDAMFTQYMYNTVLFNPAYAGSKEYMSIGLLHRSQWVGFGSGAPSSQAFNIHSPLRNEKIGLGFSLTNDHVGVTNQLGLQASYAYKIKIGEKSKLAVGLQGGLVSWRSKLSKLDQQDPNDPAFTDVDVARQLLPNFGLGLYYSAPNFYVGASVPHLIDNDLRSKGITNDTIQFARQYRHYYIHGGMAIKFSSGIVFRPSILIRNVGLFGEFKTRDRKVSAPTEFDINAGFLFNETVWVGMALRSAFGGSDQNSSYDSVDLWTQIYLTNGVRVGFAYDFTLNKIKTVSAGSIEVMLGYEFRYEKKNIVHTRYFF